MAATWRSAFNEIVVEPLTEENHVSWFASVKSYLIARDLWKVIIDDSNYERVPHEEYLWERMNAAALHAIQNSCTPQSLSLIKEVTKAKRAWQILHEKYSKRKRECPPKQEMGVEVEYDVGPLYQAIRNKDWNDAKAFIEKHPSDALKAKLTSIGQTPLHLAAQYGHVDIAKELINIVRPEYLEIINAMSSTPLAIAAAFGGDMIYAAKDMVIKNKKILGIPTAHMLLPVTLALSHGHKELGRYLYNETPLECFVNDKGSQGSLLLYWCFNAGVLDIALHLLGRCKELLFTELDSKEGWTPIMSIASMPYAFPSGTKHVFWKQWIYHYIKIPSTSSTGYVHVDIQQQSQSNRVQERSLVQRIISYAYNLIGVTEIYKAKRQHTQAFKILELICDNLNDIDTNKKQEEIVKAALFRAAKEGTVEFVKEVIEANPATVLSYDDLRRHLFFYAIEYRQVKVFSLIHKTQYKNTLVARIDRQSGNSMLHEVGKLAPSSQLNRISGAALQMQSELQWFNEVESVVPSGFRVQYNKDGRKAEDIFKESHKELRKEGEKWMRDTASSCSVVGALIVTIMFAAAFTVPGGNDQIKGYPIFLEKGKKSFMVFIMSDALSLFFSSTSLLMFLGMLTSRYAEEDFLISMPRKLIIGLSTLFLSIATMMIAFSACILIMLQHTYSRALLPVIMLASVPVTLFVLLQFPLFVHMISSTYGFRHAQEKGESDFTF